MLKPNRSYGGEGVVVGHAVDQGEWESALDARARRHAIAWVVQQAAPIPVKSFHVFDDEDQVDVEPFYVVMGFAPSRYGVALMARASQQQVVNVAQHGGMCAVMVSAKALRGEAEIGIIPQRLTNHEDRHSRVRRGRSDNRREAGRAWRGAWCLAPVSGGDHDLFVSGNDAAAKARVSELLKRVGSVGARDGSRRITTARGAECYCRSGCSSGARSARQCSTSRSRDDGMDARKLGSAGPVVSAWGTTSS